MSGWDMHLPRLRLVAARGRRGSSLRDARSSSKSSSSSSNSSKSSSRGPRSPAIPLTQSGVTLFRPGNRWMFSSSSEDSTPSTEHEWDSPDWKRRPLPSVVCYYSSASSSSSQKRRAAAADRARKNLEWIKRLNELRHVTPPSLERIVSLNEQRKERARKNLERILSLNEQRHVSLLKPPSRHSPEDSERIYKMGLLPSDDLEVAPDPFWCDQGYSSDSSSDSRTPRSALSPRNVKSDGEMELCFSVPFLKSDQPESSRRKSKPWKSKGQGKGKGKVKGRQLFLDFDDGAEDGDTI